LENRPVAFAFDGLSVNRQYHVKLEEGIDCPVKGQFHTFDGDISARPLTFACLSCNKVHVVQNLPAGQIDLWDDLAQRAEHGDIDVILHLGDQIYADEIDEGIEGGDPESVWNRMVMALHLPGAEYVKNSGALYSRMKAEGRKDSVWVIKSDGERPLEEWEDERDRILEEFRQLYRSTWGHMPTRRALANTSNVMIIDDHDICDDFGDRPFHRPREPMTPEYFVGLLALQVYHEYQRLLREDIEAVVGLHTGLSEAPVGSEGFIQRWGDVGCIFVENRTPRSFLCPPNELDGDPPLVDAGQMEMIKDALLAWQDVKHLMFCTPVPIALFSPSMTALAAKQINDCEGQFAYSQVPLAVEILELLRVWKQGQPGRELAIYAGDLHIGQQTLIKKKS